MKLSGLPTLSYVNVAPPSPSDAGVGDYQIFDLTAVDRHPQPLFRAPPLYPPAAKRLGLEGWAMVKFIVDENGAVIEVEIRLIFYSLERFLADFERGSSCFVQNVVPTKF